MFGNNTKIEKTRKATSIETAKKELYFPPNIIDPRKYIKLENFIFIKRGELWV